jgi:putative transcriptional regulator
VKSGSAGQLTADPGVSSDAAGTIRIRLDELLAARGLTLTELADRVGITVVNLSVLKNGRARAIRFSTLAGLCAALDCQPGDLLAYEPD